MINRLKGRFPGIHRSRAVEAAGFAILLVACFFIWKPLPLIVLGFGTITYAQFMRR